MELGDEEVYKQWRGGVEGLLDLSPAKLKKKKLKNQKLKTWSSKTAERGHRHEAADRNFFFPSNSLLRQGPLSPIH